MVDLSVIYHSYTLRGRARRETPRPIQKNGLRFFSAGPPRAAAARGGRIGEPHAFLGPNRALGFSEIGEPHAFLGPHRA